MSTDFSTADGENGGGLADQAQQRVQSVAAQARVRAREQVEQRSSDLAARASTVAEDLQDVAENFRSQGREGPATMAEQVAQRVSGAARYLEGSDGDRLLRDAEGLGRQRPWMAVMGGVAVGLVASRFLKASSTERYRSGYASGYARTDAPGRRGTTPGRETGGRFDPAAPRGHFTPISPVEG